MLRHGPLPRWAQRGNLFDYLPRRDLTAVRVSYSGGRPFRSQVSGHPPAAAPGTVTLAIAATTSGIAVVLAVVALFVLRPQVPERAPGQPVEQYRSVPGVGTKIVSVWFLMEGAGMLAVVGYFLTGEPIAAIAAGLTIVAFWLCGPNVFAKA